MILETVVLHALLASPAADLKCGGTVPFPGIEDRSPVVVVDGRVIVGDMESTAAQIGEIAAEDIDRVEVTCWNPTTDEMPARSGVSVIVVLTHHALEESRSDLRGLLGAVRDFEAAEARLPRTLADLGTSGLAEDRFSLTVTDGGIELRTAGARDYHCSASADVSSDVDMKCDAVFGLTKTRLREAYERGTTGG